MNSDYYPKPSIISVTSLSKLYNQNPVLNNVDFEIEEKSCTALLGENGAGKTTLINILTGLIPGNTGTIFWKGTEILANTQEHKLRIGVVPQEVSLYDNLSALDNLMFWGSLYGIKGKKLRERAKSLLSDVGLTKEADLKVGAFSGGMKRRVHLACGLLHQPELLFLDEPTVGVDPSSRQFIYSLIDKIKIQGTSILYTTHYLKEVERLCENVVILHQGKILAKGSLAELQNKFSIGEKLEITISESLYSFDEIKTVLSDLLSMEGNILVFSGKNVSERLSEIVQKLQGLEITISSIEIRKASLEDIFLELTRAGDREKEVSETMIMN